jgi:5'-deoxynucleotidase YfbR-like HD superfamily hydrolase
MGYDETLFTVLRSGNEIDLRDPDPDAVDLEDVIGNLAKITRYVGSRQTVAQHSFYVAQHLREQGEDEAVQLHGLLHDAQEAYLGDVPRPTKNLDPDFEATLDRYEDAVLAAIYEALGLELPDEATEARVKQADTEVALIELAVLGTDDVLDKTVERFPGWDRADAEKLFDATAWWQERDWDEDGDRSGELFRQRYRELADR